MFSWSDKYSVGVQSIDNQHKEILEILNRLLQALKEGKAHYVVNQIIHDLEQYAYTHFQKEEFLFQRFNYSGAAEHIHEHQQFREKIMTVKRDLISGKISFTVDLMFFLKDWVEHHILVLDKAYSDCFRQNGLR